MQSFRGLGLSEQMNILQYESIIWATADTKAKATQYFTILNRIQYLLMLDAKRAFVRINCSPSARSARQLVSVYREIGAMPKIKDV